jgi:hypothetical protein
LSSLSQARKHLIRFLLRREKGKETWPGASQMDFRGSGFSKNLPVFAQLREEIKGYLLKTLNRRAWSIIFPCLKDDKAA